MINSLPEDPKESLFNFPCPFDVKAMGKAHDNFGDLVVSIVREHLCESDDVTVKTRPSKAGNFTAATVSFTATSRAQLDAIYQSLTDHPEVLMSL
jgi:putative lipoic acid-binding regulatory protein